MYFVDIRDKKSGSQMSLSKDIWKNCSVLEVISIIKTKEQILSTIVLMLDVITSFNFPCYTALFVVYHR
jgi:hypothetical protein